MAKFGDDYRVVSKILENVAYCDAVNIPIYNCSWCALLLKFQESSKNQFWCSFLLEISELAGFLALYEHKDKLQKCMARL